MILGVPFYGWDFTDQSNVKSVTFGQMVSQNASYAYIDQVGEIYYNGLETISKKCQLALENLSGIMIWELGQDSFDEYSLLKRIDQNITEYFGSGTLENKTSAITLYPNPTYQRITIELSSPQYGTISIYNSSQVKLKESHFTNKEKINFDMEAYKTGMYFLTLKTDKYVKTLKVLKI